MSDTDDVFIQVKKLIYEEKQKEALKLLEAFEAQEEVSEIELLKALLLKIKLMLYWGFYEEANRLSDRAILEGQRLKSPLYVLDAFNEKMEVLWWLRRENERLTLLEKWEKLLQLTEKDQDNSSEFKKRKGYFLLNKSGFSQSEDNRESFDLLEKRLALFEEVGDKQGIGQVYQFIAAFIGWREDYEKFLSYVRKSQAAFEEIGDKYRKKEVGGLIPRL